MLGGDVFSVIIKWLGSLDSLFDNWYFKSYFHYFLYGLVAFLLYVIFFT